MPTNIQCAHSSKNVVDIIWLNYLDQPANPQAIGVTQYLTYNLMSDIDLSHDFLLGIQFYFENIYSMFINIFFSFYMDQRVNCITSSRGLPMQVRTYTYVR